MFKVLADTVLLLHAGIVMFVVGGLALTLVGGSNSMPRRDRHGEP